MAHYKTKPIIVEATQFDPHCQPWPAGVIPWSQTGYRPRDMSWGCIQTASGRLHVCAGDWIITDINGAKSICKPSIFKWLYERVEEREEVK